MTKSSRGPSGECTLESIHRAGDANHFAQKVVAFHERGVFLLPAFRERVEPRESVAGESGMAHDEMTRTRRLQEFIEFFIESLACAKPREPGEAEIGRKTRRRDAPAKSGAKPSDRQGFAPRGTPSQDTADRIAGNADQWSRLSGERAVAAAQDRQQSVARLGQRVNMVMPIHVVRRGPQRRFEDIELPLELGGDRGTSRRRPSERR